MFDSIFVNGIVGLTEFAIIMAAALLIGIGFSLINSIKTSSSKSFVITTALIPLAVSMVIMLVNGNIGAGVAVAGAFSLIRFRSTPGTAKEICVIFLDMAIGLALGMGYVGYAVIFAIVASLALLGLSFINIFSIKENEKFIRVMIPEDLDYPTVFDDIFKKYTTKVELLKVKSKNMGSMFALTYAVTLKDVNKEKDLVDELRCRNGNLEIMVCRKDMSKEEL